MMDTQVESRTHGFWLFLLQAATLGAVLATVFSALSFTASAALAAVATRQSEFEPAPTLWDIAKGTGLLCVITVVWYGPFGLLAGAIGAVVLHRRRPRIHSLKRLLIEAAAFGLLAAISVPFYDAVCSRSLRYIGYGYSGAQLIAIIPFCVASSVIGSVSFRSRVIPKN